MEFRVLVAVTIRSEAKSFEVHRRFRNGVVPEHDREATFRSAADRDVHVELRQVGRKLIRVPVWVLVVVLRLGLAQSPSQTQADAQPQ